MFSDDWTSAAAAGDAHVPSVHRQIAQLFLTEFSHISLSAPRILVNFALRPANLFEIRSRASAREAAAASPARSAFRALS